MTASELAMIDCTANNGRVRTAASDKQEADAVESEPDEVAPRLQQSQEQPRVEPFGGGRLACRQGLEHGPHAVAECCAKRADQAESHRREAIDYCRARGAGQTLEIATLCRKTGST